MEPYMVGAITGLSAAVVALWRVTRKHEKFTETRLAECEQDRNDLWDMMISVLDAYMRGDTRGLARAAHYAQKKVEDRKRPKPPSDVYDTETNTLAES